MKKSILPEIFERLKKDYPCCQFAQISIHNLYEKEKDFFKSFMPDAVSAISVAHHIVAENEWTWYQPQEGLERCDADDHTFGVCNRIKDELENRGFKAKIVPYPNETGLEFRNVAKYSGIGQIGKNAFLIHPDWGPWVHLRVIATDANSDAKTQAKMVSILENTPNEICGDCMKCIDSCPAGAFKNGFNGLICRKYRKDNGEYTPIGQDQVYKYCKICASVCTLGKNPKPKS